jgi:hypothetical protein
MNRYLPPHQELTYNTYPGIPMGPALVVLIYRLRKNGIQPYGAGADVEEGDVEC